MRQETQTTNGKTAPPKSAPKKSSAKARSEKKAPTTVITTYSSTEQISPEYRYHMISEAAYFIAEERGFGDGAEVDDWLRAEASVDEWLRDGNSASEKR